jgi:predicted HTH domain antitoxin
MMERMTYVQLNVRLAPELAEQIKEIAQEEKLARTDVVRQLLSEGAERWKLERAIRLYREGQITKARAAEIAGISLYDMHDVIRQRGIPLHYSLDEAREDMQLIMERAGLESEAVLNN